MSIDDDHRLARELAQEAGLLLVGLRERLVAEKVDATELGARGDIAANELIVARLAAERPGDVVLSEEFSAVEHADRTRLQADRVWIVDPLDGTREFGEQRHDWAVHIALVEDHRPTAAAVALTDLGVVYGTDEAPRPATTASMPPRVVVSRTRPPIETRSVLDALGATLQPMGSAGAKAMAVLRGDAEVYLHSGGLNEWDACAPAAVAVAAGLHVSHIDGSPLRFNQPDVNVSDLLVCRPELADATIAAAAAGRSDLANRSPL